MKTGTEFHFFNQLNTQRANKCHIELICSLELRKNTTNRKFCMSTVKSCKPVSMQSREINPWYPLIPVHRKKENRTIRASEKLCKSNRQGQRKNHWALDSRLRDSSQKESSHTIVFASSKNSNLILLDNRFSYLHERIYVLILNRTVICATWYFTVIWKNTRIRTLSYTKKKN